MKNLDLVGISNDSSRFGNNVNPQLDFKVNTKTNWYFRYSMNSVVPSIESRKYNLLKLILRFYLFIPFRQLLVTVFKYWVFLQKFIVYRELLKQLLLIHS
jgi:hypothetical protein